MMNLLPLLPVLLASISVAEERLSPEVIDAIRAAVAERPAPVTKWRPEFGFSPWAEDVRPAIVEIAPADAAPLVCREFHRRGIKVQVTTTGADDHAEVWARLTRAGIDRLQTELGEELLARQILKSLPSRPVKIAHHRGAAKYAPENTLPALETSIRLGADFVEFDLQTTRDGGSVLLHDRTLSRTTNGKGAVRECDLSQIQALDAGSWFAPRFAGTKVPTLDQFLEAAGRRVELYVDAKDIAPEILAATLKRHGLVDRAVVYQRAEYLERLRAIDPTIRRMPPLRDPALLDVTAERVRPYAFDTRWSILSKDLIDRCHKKGIQVFADALGSHETIPEYQRAINDGIDLIQTDNPVRVLRALELSHFRNTDPAIR